MLSENQELVTAEQDVCCPLFHPEQWDGVKHYWEGKLFLRDSVPELLHVPLPGLYAKVIERMWRKAKTAEAAPDVKDFLLLAHDPTPFKCELYMAISKDIPGGKTVTLTGIFMGKVFEGSYGDIPRFIRNTHRFLNANGMTSLKDYVNYPYCPKCAKKYGHNYIVVVSQIAASVSQVNL